MKYTTLYLEENTIEIHNSIWGKETIIVNGEIVSSKYSFFGAKHIFNSTENNKEVAWVLEIGMSMRGVTFNLHKDGIPVIVSHKNTNFVLGIMLGIVFVTIMIRVFEYYLS